MVRANPFVSWFVSGRPTAFVFLRVDGQRNTLSAIDLREKRRLIEWEGTDRSLLRLEGRVVGVREREREEITDDYRHPRGANEKYRWEFNDDRL